MNPLTKRAKERNLFESRLNYMIAIVCGIVLGLMFGCGV